MAAPKAPTPMTKEQTATVNDFTAWREANSISLAEVARKIDYSPGVISEVERRVYCGRTGHVVSLLKGLMDRWAAEQRAIKPPPFVATSVARTAYSVFATCFIGGRIGFLCGRSGTGRTMAAVAYREAHEDDCILITCAPNFTPADMLRHLGDALDVKLEGPHNVRYVAVAAALEDRKPLVLVDEVDFANRDTVQTLRHLRDRSGCGVCLIGTPAFLENLRRRPKGTDGQLLGRLAPCVAVEKILEDDIDQLASFFDLDSDALVMAATLCGSNARRLVNGLVVAAELAQGEPITAKHVKAAFASLMPDRI